MNTTAPKRIWIDLPYGRDCDDWWFTDTPNVAKSMVEYVPKSEYDKLDAEMERLKVALAHYATDESADGWVAIEALKPNPTP